MSLKDTILILLYRQSGIITTEQLKGNLDKRHHKNFFTALGRLKNEFLVYVNGKNVKITRKGIAQVETQILRNK